MALRAKKYWMCKANSFLLGVLPDIYRIMVAERERVRGLVQQPAHPKVSLSRPTATGGDEEMLTQNYPSERNNSDAVVIGPRRPAGNVASRQRIVPNPFTVKHAKCHLF